MHVYRLSHIETGRAPLNEETLNALAELYDCSADDLLNREPGGKTLPADRLSFEGERLLREMQRNLADIRNARTVTIQMLAKHNATLNTISAEQRALRSQLDRFRAEMRKELSALRAVLSGGDERGNG
jgi:transcriptional regulator with XRE-family HTH domain